MSKYKSLPPSNKQWQQTSSMTFDDLVSAREAALWHMKNKTAQKYAAAVSVKAIDKELTKRLTGDTE